MKDKFSFVMFLISSFYLKQLYAAGDPILESKMKIRLPDTLEPEKYEIDIYTDVMKLRPHFYGEVYVTIKCRQRTKKIIMNRNLLTIKAIEVWSLTNDGKKDQKLSIKDKDFSLNGDQFKIELTDNLEKDNRYGIKMEYSKPPFSNVDVGFKFLPHEKRKQHPNIQYLAFTQMNDVEASRVFPCLDQIGMKATFKIRLGHSPHVKSFSNARKIDTVDINDPEGWVMDIFEDTNSISTFSVAFVVADYESIGPATFSTDTVPYIEIKLWADKKVLDEMKEVMETVMDAFSRSYVFFSKFFNISCKLKKLDLIVVPDNNVDVQDSYGLIIIRKNDILKTFDVSNKNKMEKYTVLSKICYAVSRQWVGHFVSMSAWNETWLDVGLNSVLQKLCVNEVFPDRRSYLELRLVESYFVLLKTEERGDYNPIVSLGYDSFFTSASSSPETYSKIFHAIRMLSFILESNKNVFRQSIENYLKEFELGNANVDKLWGIFTKTANDEDRNLLPDGITVKNIMDSWLGQKGHPHITVYIDTKTNEIVVNQEAFNFSDIGKKKDEVEPRRKQCWIIPLSFTTKKTMEFQKVRVQEWLKCDENPVRIKHSSVENWILFRHKLNVPCRVTYEYQIWLSIQKSLLNPKEYLQFDYLTRILLTSDMFALAEAEKLSYEFLFNTIAILSHEENFECWKLAVYELNQIRFRWIGTTLHSHFLEFIRETLRPILKDKIFKGTFSTNAKFLKSIKPENDENDSFEEIVLMAACLFETFQCLQLTQKLRNEWGDNEGDIYAKQIPGYLRESVYCLAGKHADEKEWNFLFEMYDKKKTPNSHFNKIVLTALSCSSKRDILQKYLDWSMDLENPEFSLELSLKVFQVLTINEVAYPLIMDYLRNDFKNLKEYLMYRRSDIAIEHFLTKALRMTKTRKDYIELVNMLPSDSRRNTKIAEMVDENKSIADRNIRWLERNKENMINYFINKPKTK